MKRETVGGTFSGRSSASGCVGHLDASRQPGQDARRECRTLGPNVQNLLDLLLRKSKRVTNRQQLTRKQETKEATEGDHQPVGLAEAIFERPAARATCSVSPTQPIYIWRSRPTHPSFRPVYPSIADHVVH